MKPHSFTTFFYLMTALLSPIHPAQALDPNDPQAVAVALSTAFGRAAKSITPSVVTITVSGTKHEKPTPQPSVSPTPATPGQVPPESFRSFGSGTGIILDEAGFILTNNHVVQDGTRVTVQLADKRTVPAEIAGTNVRADLALLKISAADLEPAPLGNSDALIVGQWVVAAGNPFGLGNSITAGIVSAFGRALISGMPDLDFIQTDAAINPGNSGGPLINLDGEVVGINAAIFSRSGGNMGIGFAIPINRAKGVIAELKAEFIAAEKKQSNSAVK